MVYFWRCNFAVGWQSLNEDMLATTSDEIPWAAPLFLPLSHDQLFSSPPTPNFVDNLFNPALALSKHNSKSKDGFCSPTLLTWPMFWQLQASTRLATLATSGLWA